MKNRDIIVRILFLAFIVLCFFACLITGCSKTVYVPIESTKIEYRDRLLRDSVMRYDSIYIKEVSKGDTIRINIEKYKYIYRDKIVSDSIFRNDTIRVPIRVERQLSKWESTKMDAGGWAIGVASGFLLLGIIYIVAWINKKRFI